MDDTDYKKQRSSLILISMAIILYILGEGHIGTKGGIFGGTIIFKKPEILEIAGIVIYLWLNWRYALSCKPFIKKFGTHFRYFLYKSSTYKAIITDRFQKLKEKASNASYIDHFMNKTFLWHDEGDGTIPPLIKNLFWPSSLYFNHERHIASNADKYELTQGNVITTFPVPSSDKNKISVIPAPFIKLIALEAFILVRVAWAHKPFSDIVAPFIISLYAAYLLYSQTNIFT
ncbi:MAG: hypothetical protein OEY89_10205 [Gammaproteobacteria bacterium]|nr:hypothetical protein [Gammaproteobacteria bacterium]